MKFTFTMRTADYEQELAVQKDKRLGATQGELDRHTVTMVLGNVCTMPATITVGEDKDELVVATITTECSQYLEVADRYCEARGFDAPVQL